MERIIANILDCALKNLFISLKTNRKNKKYLNSLKIFDLAVTFLS